MFGTVCDCHAHLPRDVSIADFLSVGHHNLLRAAPPKHAIGPDRVAGVLCLVDASTEGSRERLEMAVTSTESHGDWSIQSTLDPELMMARRSSGGAVLLALGHQIVTAERLEVLSLVSRLRVSDGLPLLDTIAQVQETGAVPTLPWGVGKWMGRRGSAVRMLIRDLQPGEVAFADTGGRPEALPEPALLRQAADAGFPVLAGTDPLAVCGDWHRVGSYGSVLPLPESIADIGAEPLRAALRCAATPSARFGRRVSWRRFACVQVALRTR